MGKRTRGNYLVCQMALVPSESFEVAMTPTQDQLNVMSAEACGFTWTLGGNLTLQSKECVILRWVCYGRDEKWLPSTDLSQAWREFVPIILQSGRHVKIDTRLSGQVCVVLSNPSSHCFHDDNPAYALTWAFVQAIGPEKSKTYAQFLKEAA